MIADHFPEQDLDASEYEDYPHFLDNTEVQALADRYTQDNATMRTCREEFDLAYDEWMQFRQVHELRHNRPTAVDPEKDLNEIVDHLTQREKRKATERKAVRRQKRERKKAAENWWAMEEAIDEAIEKASGADYEPPKLQLTISDQVERDPACLVANASDYHLGNRPVHDGMGPEAYADALLEANESVARRAVRSGDVDKVFLVIGGDLLNVDNAQEQTTRGTSQKNQMSTSDLLHHAEMFGRDLVNIYRQVGPVELVYCRGNHDAVLSQAIYQMLDAHFGGEDVTADRDFAQRQYRTWRDAFFCITHGDYSRKIFKRLPRICINEARSEIAGTEHSTIHTGHLHSEKVRFDESGWVHQQAPAPVQLDDWHEGKGYVGSRQAVQGTLHFEGGADHVINETL